jgi:regulator of replication initiation timing
MVKQSAAARTVDLDPIDRLEDKVRLLVELVTELRSEQSKAADENTRLRNEVATLRSKLVDVEGNTSELVALRDERDVVRSRVADMLRQLDHLSL